MDCVLTLLRLSFGHSFPCTEMPQPHGGQRDVKQSRKQSADRPPRKWTPSAGSNKPFDSQRDRPENSRRPAVAHEISDGRRLGMPTAGRSTTKHQSDGEQEAAHSQTRRQIALFSDGHGNFRAKFKEDPEQEKARCAKGSGEEVVHIRRSFAKATTGIDYGHGQKGTTECDERRNVSSLHYVVA